MPVHKDLSGLELHDAYHFVQETDPGAVGAEKYWLKMSTRILSRRNDANDAWLTISGAAGGSDKQLLFNDNGLIGGVAGTTWSGTTLTLGTAVIVNSLQSMGGLYGDFIQLVNPVDVGYGGTGSTTPAGGLNNLLPTQTGNAGKALVTDGSTHAWSLVGLNSISGLGTGVATALGNTLDATSGLASKAYVDNAVTGLLDFKGNLACAADPNYPAGLKGDVYYTSTAGHIGGASGKLVDVGDAIVCSADNAGGTEASVGTSWFVMEHNLNGLYTDPLTTKGDILARNATITTRLGVGSNDQALVADSTAATGLKWATVSYYVSPLTTKGDVLGYSTIPARVPVGTDGHILVADSGQATGVKWALAGSGGAVPLWVSNDLRTPPSSANAMDDEFTSSATLPGGGSAKWTWRNQGTGTISIFSERARIVFNPGNSTYISRFIYQTAPTAPWEFIAKFSADSSLALAQVITGIALERTSNSNVLLWGYGLSNNNRINMLSLNGGNTLASNYISTGGTGFEWMHNIYLKITNDATTLGFYISKDGILWTLCGTQTIATYIGVINNIGFGTVNTTNLQALTADLDFFRRTV